jgi:hypothetical protein
MKRKIKSIFDDDDDDNDDNNQNNNNNNFLSQNRSNGRFNNKKKKPKQINTDDVDADNNEIPVPPRIPYDNRKLRFAKNIDRNDGTSFDYVKSTETKKYLPQTIADELDYTSCEELEQNYFQTLTQQAHNHPHSHGHSHQNGQTHSSFSSSSPSSETNENLFGDSSSDNENSKRSPPLIERDEDSSDNFNDVLNMPTSNNLNEIEQSRHMSQSPVGPSVRQRPTKFCFGCSWQDPNKINTDFNAVSHMMQTMYRFFGQIQTRELAKIIHKQFMSTVYYPFLQQQEEKRRDDEFNEILPQQPIYLPIWRTKEIYQHLRSHVKDPRFFIHNKIEELEEDSEVLNGMTYSYVRDDHNNEYLRPDLAVIKTRLDINKRQIELYNLNFKKMNFYNETLPINIDLSGSAMNIHKHLTIRDRQF